MRRRRRRRRRGEQPAAAVLARAAVGVCSGGVDGDGVGGGGEGCPPARRPRHRCSHHVYVLPRTHLRRVQLYVCSVCCRLSSA